jgi:formiminotetrahydrofolate cyclodeaminase
MSVAGNDRPAAVETLLDALGGKATWPSAGAGAGLVVALAAGLIEAVARRSSQSWDEAGGAIAQATALRRRALRLASEDVEAHLEASSALDTASREKPERDHEIADLRLGAALALAADMPLEIAAAASDAAALAAEAAERGAEEARPDAAGAALLAAGAAAAAGHLVEVNLSMRADDERVAQARQLVSAAREASERALAERDD